jgi:hypothetical protein
MLYFVAASLYFIIVPYLTNGRTFGKWVVRIRITGREPRLRLHELAIRNGLLYLVLGGLNVLFIVAGLREPPAIVMAFYAVGLFIINAWFAVHLLVRLFNRSKKLFYEERSGTGHTIT